MIKLFVWPRYVLIEAGRHSGRAPPSNLLTRIELLRSWSDPAIFIPQKCSALIFFLRVQLYH